MITELDRIKALESELAALKAQISAKVEGEVKKLWNPSGGKYAICRDGSVDELYYSAARKAVNNGCVYKTQAQAEQAAIAMRKHNRLVAYVIEAIANSDDPNWVADWSNHYQRKYKILFDNRVNEYYKDHNSFVHTLNSVYMPEKIAKELVDKLNSGEVVL